MVVGERRSGGERKDYLADHPAGTPPQTLAATVKARWACEQAHRRMKEELGLDRFEGRSWAGLHHHALMALIAFAFLQHLRLRQSGQRGKTCTTGPPPQPTLPAVRRALLAHLATFVRLRCPRCREVIVLRRLE